VYLALSLFIGIALRIIAAKIQRKNVSAKEKDGKQTETYFISGKTISATQGTDTCSGKKYHDLSLLSFFFVSLQMQTACCGFSVTQYDTYLL
jgi:hypothetical protein